MLLFLFAHFLTILNSNSMFSNNIIQYQVHPVTNYLLLFTVDGSAIDRISKLFDRNTEFLDKLDDRL